MDGVALAAIVVSGVVGITGASVPVLYSLSERHGKERRRIIEQRADAYLALVASLGPSDRSSETPPVDAKISLYASAEMWTLYRQWVEAPADSTERGQLATNIRDQAASEIQETVLNNLRVRSDRPRFPRHRQRDGEL
jgi:hypothetical protein